MRVIKAPYFALQSTLLSHFISDGETRYATADRRKIIKNFSRKISKEEIAWET
jgi:hypothetical protein